MHKYNFENATEKRRADKELGHILTPHPDGQIKHPEHLNEHEMLQILQRESLNGNWSVVKDMLLEFPESKRKDLVEMLRRANKDPLIGKDFPDEEWFKQKKWRYQ
jgi:hypothetical protein